MNLMDGHLVRLLDNGLTSTSNMIQVHAHEIFVDGTFNGDPHPGNIMLLPDGRLGLIDYGQVKHIDLATRKSYARLIIALDEEHQEEVFRIVQQELGCRSKFNNPSVQYRIAAFWSDRDTRDITGGRNIAEFMDWAEAEDPVVSLAQEVRSKCCAIVSIWASTSLTTCLAMTVRYRRL